MIASFQTVKTEKYEASCSGTADHGISNQYVKTFGAQVRTAKCIQCNAKTLYSVLKDHTCMLLCLDAITGQRQFFIEV